MPANGEAALTTDPRSPMARFQSAHDRHPGRNHYNGSASTSLFFLRCTDLPPMHSALTIGHAA